jgi:hypothetical protein
MFILDADSLHGVSEVHAGSIFKDEANVVGEGWCAVLASGDRRQGSALC